MHRPQTDFS
uniref:Uncharacterized protein n=1 Tax=Arundo donax TaxID=35708 RepID=A0A0A9ANR2_ARUDO